MEFDIDLARRQSNENPVFYAQYASARLHNVMAIAGAKAEADPAAADLSLLATEWEQDLLRHLLQFPEVVALAARGREPHRVIYYTNDLAQRIHVFYKNCRVLGSEPPLEAARLVLCRAALTVLRNALGLAGVSAPAQM
jgi:arginyl-tRNA synthetase